MSYQFWRCLIQYNHYVFYFLLFFSHDNKTRTKYSSYVYRIMPYNEAFPCESIIWHTFFLNTMIVLYKTSPKLVRYLFEKYVRAYCEGKFDSLLPLNIAKFGANDEFMAILKEFLTNLPKINKDDNIKIHSLIHQLSNQTIH